MQLPLWFSLWQSLDSLLAIALNAAEAFPFLLFLCLFLFRSRRAPFLADSGRIFLKLWRRKGKESHPALRSGESRRKRTKKKPESQCPWSVAS